MHTYFSGDSDADPEEMIKTAVSKGLKSISITDHYDLECADYVDEGIFDIDEYFKVLYPLKEKYKSKIEVNIGVEIGMQPMRSELFRSMISIYPFEFVIGSVHVIGGKDPAFGQIFENKKDEDVYQEYFEEELQNIKECKDFNVLGHLDYVVRYGHKMDKSYKYENHKEVIDDILKELIYTGRGIEVNAAGLKYGLPFAHPMGEIIKRYVELGGEILTIGSDAHKPEHIAYDFSKVKDYLVSCNVKNYTIFSSGRIKFYQLT